MVSQNLPCFPPISGRVHEVCGPGAIGYVAVLMANTHGPVLWVQNTHNLHSVNPVGLGLFADPARLLTARVTSHSDGLSAAEEALRSGAVPLVVIDISKPLSLTAGRRLQLAAKAGKTIGLCVISGEMGSNAAETRWHCAPALPHDTGKGNSALFHWSLIKSKTGTLGSWHVQWDYAARRLDVVSPPCKRPGFAQAPG